MKFMLTTMAGVSAAFGVLLSLLSGSWAMLAIVCAFMGASACIGFCGAKLALAEDKMDGVDFDDATMNSHLHMECR